MTWEELYTKYRGKADRSSGLRQAEYRLIGYKLEGGEDQDHAELLEWSEKQRLYVSQDVYRIHREFQEDLKSVPEVDHQWDEQSFMTDLADEGE